MDGINKYNEFVALHKTQLESSAVPVHLWPALYRKLNTDTFDAGVALQLMLIDYDDDDDEQLDPDDDDNARPVFALEVAREQGLKASDPQAIYLVDHAWTFRLNSARQQLEQYPQLADRLSAITGVDLEHEQRVDKILRRLWKYCHAYSLASEGLSDEERMPIWYVMDEVGSAVNHSDEPSFRLVPLLHLNTQTTYSLLFPIRDCEQGTPVTRDFAEYVAKDALQRSALLLPWRESDLSAESFLQVEPSAEYFSSGHIHETYPADESASAATPAASRCDPLKVYAEYDVLRANLTAPEFVLVDSADAADVLWLTCHYKHFAELAQQTPHRFINQFPFEYVITIKDLLSIVGRRAALEHHNAETLETYPAWLPTTYNLSTELREFVAYYQQRAARGLDNHWIIKPWNLARGLDTHITDNIKQIVRLPATGPKIAQKYIERPVLFRREELDAQVKFDVRYVILLKRVKPLEAYVHRKFYLRFANRPFSLDHFDDYEKHYTVMNYQEQAQLHHIRCEDFLALWQQQYPQHEWSALEQQICAMLYEVLQCASKEPPPRGLAPCAQSRALYAADIMLAWTGSGNEQQQQQQRIQPKLLEINWTPDCKRACDYYPEFFNDIFKLLFLDEQNNESFRLLTADGQ
ncbi:hypothetical protein KR222_007834 [Zaprionus bogoriensis]|nr:hypothetical protein KR222_007834 [Zaprionus bogoriensis]